MNDFDLRMVRTVLDDVPPPSSARLAAGRARLLAAAAHSGPGTVPGAHGASGTGRQRWRITPPAKVAVAAFAAVVSAAAVAMTAFSGGGSSAPGVAGSEPVQPRLATPAHLAAQVLSTAARAVASEPTAEPADGQWIYSRSVSTRNGRIVGSPYEEWITFDGTHTAYYGAPHAGAPVQLILNRRPASAVPVLPPGASALDAWDSYADPLTAYNALASLSANPAALLSTIGAQVTKSGQTMFGVMGFATTMPQKEFAYLSALLWNAYAAAPPPALAAVYQAFAALPGVTVHQGDSDAAGQPAIGVSDNGGKTELLLDPHTYQVVGINLWSGVPKGPHGKPKGAAGTFSIAYLRIAEVSRPGQR